jgi:hypothetical protein
LRPARNERTGIRTSALWGKGEKTGPVALALAGIALTAPWAATAGPGGPDKGSGSANVYIPGRQGGGPERVAGRQAGRRERSVGTRTGSER